MVNWSGALLILFADYFRQVPGVSLSRLSSLYMIAYEKEPASMSCEKIVGWTFTKRRFRLPCWSAPALNPASPMVSSGCSLGNDGVPCNL